MRTIAVFLLMLTIGMSASAAAPREADSVVLTMLDVRDNGFNSNPSINNGLGGLYINWRYGSKPFEANFTGDGKSDITGTSARHDVLTDLRCLHNLLL